MTTRTGEISVKVTSLELLAKAIRPLPDKWHGLADPDIRYRQRYADLVVNANARRVFEIRHAVLTSFRTTLSERGFVEVETPIFHVEPGGAHARPFVTHHNTLDMPLYLRVATELHLKRLIVGGLDRVFEIGRTFRNEGMDATHNPEFTMMESYQAFGDVSDVIELTEALIVNAARDAVGTTVIDIAGEPVDLAEPWPRLGMADAVSDAVAAKVHPSTPVETMRSIADTHGVRWEPSWGSGKLIEELFEKLCEDRIVRPTFVTGHPVEVSPLARVDPDRSRRVRSLRVVHQRQRVRQRLQRAQRSRSSNGSASRTSRRPRTPATSSAAASTRTTSGRWSTGCRRPPDSASASTAW